MSTTSIDPLSPITATFPLTHSSLPTNLGIDLSFKTATERAVSNAMRNAPLSTSSRLLPCTDIEKLRLDSVLLLATTEYLNAVLNKSVWPKDTLVKEFIPRGRSSVNNLAAEYANVVPSDTSRQTMAIVLLINGPEAKH
uniref:Uncharacterized protein n=1 Tax=Glossina austeni TaxID=7395 RepID=A0A1A9UXS4_GLOAU